MDIKKINEYILDCIGNEAYQIDCKTKAEKLLNKVTR